MTGTKPHNARDLGPKSPHKEAYSEGNWKAREAAILRRGKPTLATNVETGEALRFRSMGECAALFGVTKAAIRWRIHQGSVFRGFILSFETK